MLWYLLGHVISTLFSLIRVSGLSKDDKDLEIIILRHQLDAMVRKQTQPIKPNKVEKVTLAQLTAKLEKSSNRLIQQLGDVIRIVQPETVIRWHRELVHRKWTQALKNKGGRDCSAGTLLRGSKHYEKSLLILQKASFYCQSLGTAVRHTAVLNLQQNNSNDYSLSGDNTTVSINA